MVPNEIKGQKCYINGNFNKKYSKISVKSSFFAPRITSDNQNIASNHYATLNWKCIAILYITYSELAHANFSVNIKCNFIKTGNFW